VFGDWHVRYLLVSHLKKDAPISRAVDAVCSIVALPLLGGLPRQYVRIDFR
jgi:hypothetical protein